MEQTATIKAENIDQGRIYIGGLSSVLNTESLLATEFGIVSTRVSDVIIDGDNVSCMVLDTFAQVQLKFSNKTILTYFYDPTGRITTINQGVFNTVVNFQRCYFPKVTFISSPTGYSTFSGTGLKGHLIFPELTQTQNFFLNGASQVTTLYCPKYNWANIQDNNRSSMSGMSNLNRWYIPVCVTFTPRYDFYLSGVKVGCKLYCDASLLTSNGGLRDAFIAYMEDTRLMVPIYVQNFSAPNEVIDLSYSNITASSVDLNFTAPSINVNANDFYEVWINDGVNQWQQYVSHQEITASGDTVSDLVSATTYSIKIKTADIYYNLSSFSNEITITTT